jgi:hypothetical protein
MIEEVRLAEGGGIKRGRIKDGREIGEEVQG